MTSVVRGLFGVSMLLVWTGCSSSDPGGSNANPAQPTGTGGNGNSSNNSNSATKGGMNTASSSTGGTSSTSNAAGGTNTVSNSAGGAPSSSAGGANATSSSKGGTASGAGGGGGASATGAGVCAFSCQDHCTSLGGTLKDGTCEGTQKCCDLAVSGAGGSSVIASGGTKSGTSNGGTSSSSSSTGGTSNASSSSTVGGTSSSVSDTAPCTYECTDFCLNNGGERMPGTCSKAGDVCCNVPATDITVTGKEYYIDSTGGNDANDGSSPEKAWKTLAKLKSAGSGSVVNLKRGGVWETTGAVNLTNITMRPYDKGARPVVNGKKIIVPQSLGTIVLKGKSILDGVKVTSDQGFGAYINGDNNVIRNCEVDGADTGALMGIGIVGNNNAVTNCYVHDLTTNTGDTGDVNSSGGAEGIVVFGGSHIDVGHNTVARAHCVNKTLGGDEGGCTEIIMNPMFFTTYGDTIEDVQMHHNLCVDTVGLFESCQGTGEVGFDPTKKPGTIKDITVAYNVVLDSKWMYLAQIVNTIHKNVIFEHNTIIHGPRNDTQWSSDAMSHEYMLGMFFSNDTINKASVSDNLTADQIINRNNMFWEPFTKEDVFIGYTSGHSNNLFGPATISLEKRWVLDPTEKKVADLGLVDVFHPTATSPAVDKASDKSFFETDFYGNAKCGAAADIGAVEYCENATTKPKSEEIARYLKANSK